VDAKSPGFNPQHCKKKKNKKTENMEENLAGQAPDV
jgi:hypothetical protein